MRKSFIEHVELFLGKADAKSTISTEASLTAEGSVNDTHHHSLDIPKDTVMAYGCYGFIFDDSTGMMELAIEKKLEDVTDAAPYGETRKELTAFDHPDGQGLNIYLLIIKSGLLYISPIFILF